MSGVRTVAALLVGFLALFALGASIASCVDKAEAIQAERPDVLDAGPPPPRPCAAEGSAPTDYRPLQPRDGEVDPPTVAELEDRCLEETNYFGWSLRAADGPYTNVSCWSGKPLQSLELWSRAVFVGP